MNIQILKPQQSLNKAFRKVKPHRNEIELFRSNLIRLLDRINDFESEEWHKNLISDFLKKTWYDPAFYINTSGRSDLVIHNGESEKTSVGVILETKKPTNQYEMPSRDSINVKAVHELLLYYLRDRISGKNTEIRHLIVTNVYEWFIFDANTFEKCFARNKGLIQRFTDFENGRLSGKNTDFFYKEIAMPFIDEIQQSVDVTVVDLRDYNSILRDPERKNENKLIAFFKILSPEHLLKLPFVNDSNSLDKRFYGELLHIIGLSETKQGSKKLIGRNKENLRNSGSLLESTIIQLDSLDILKRMKNPQHFGQTYDEQLFNAGLELCITWINRILFLKLLEAQLITYHNGDISYAFLNIGKIRNYDDLNTLFFQVLARKHGERNEDVKTAFEKIPYLNSSLFEASDMEYETLFISNLQDDKTLPLYSSTVLKNSQGKRQTGVMNTLEYLFAFLDAYDFSSEGSEDIQEDKKSLINASVLGLIFEKINGYKDGSYFTPGFITEYMCRETIRRAVVQKFNDEKGWSCENPDDLYDRIEDRKEANDIVNSLKICDPAVGSGHFLVSALNEILAVKNDLRILSDRQGRRLKEYKVEVVNDELIVSDENDELFEYNPKSPESQRVQEALFHEKETIIENCLFGVDINPNSVKICRLRLWIELLKHAYYKNDIELETLPNIDINIKCGNSLISRFPIDADLGQALKKSKWNMDSYRLAVATYRNAETKDQKRDMKRLIDDIKGNFRTEISAHDPKVIKLNKRRGELFNLTNQTQLFQQSEKEKARWRRQVEELTKEIRKLEQDIEAIKNNKIYENAFEWRFEFPEVLNDKGDFIGFDVVIGNPPYIGFQELTGKDYFNKHYKTAAGKYDIYVLFIELMSKIVNNSHQSSYILPHKYLNSGFGSKLRELIKEFGLIRRIIHFKEYMVFEDATTYTCITIFSFNNKILEFVKVRPEEINTKVGYKWDSLSYKMLSNKPWYLVNQKTNSIIDKIKSYGINSKNIFKGIFQGIVTGDNNSFYLYNCRQKNELIYGFSKLVNKEVVIEANICQKLLNGKNLEKWFINFDNTYIIYPYELKGDNTTLIKEEFISNNYPLAYNYLLTIKDRLSNRGTVNMKYQNWYALWNARSINNLNSSKILTPDICLGTKLSIDEDGDYYHNDTSYCIIPKTEYKHLFYYFIGVLNSKLIWFYLSNTGNVVRGGYFRFKTNYLKEISIPINQPELVKHISENVHIILTEKKNSLNFNPIKHENIIDKLVYDLYGLTEEEIAVVEGGVN